MGSSLTLERVHFLYGHKHHTITHVFTQFSSKKNDIYIVPIISLIIYHLNGWIVFHNIIRCGICKYSSIDKHLAFSFLALAILPAFYNPPECPSPYPQSLSHFPSTLKSKGLSHCSLLNRNTGLLPNNTFLLLRILSFYLALTTFSATLLAIVSFALQIDYKLSEFRRLVFILRCPSQFQYLEPFKLASMPRFSDRKSGLTYFVN